MLGRGIQTVGGCSSSLQARSRSSAFDEPTDRLAGADPVQVVVAGDPSEIPDGAAGLDNNDGVRAHLAQAMRYGKLIFTQVSLEGVDTGDSEVVLIGGDRDEASATIKRKLNG